MTEKEKMLSGALYMAPDAELSAMNRRARRLTRLFNQTTENIFDERIALLRELLGSAGKNVWVEPTFHCDYGSNIHVGDYFYANYDCIILDICPVTIGDHVFFAPRVCIYTATHPIDATVRNTGLEYGKPVSIGNNVWIGGSTVINPGVSIGDNTVIGSGSVVTKDIPSNVIAAGNPCKVLRPITEEDHAYWREQEKQYRSGCQ